MPVFESPKETWLRSVAFSPVDPMLVASGGGGGSKLFDIRHNSFRYSKFINYLKRSMALATTITPNKLPLFLTFTFLVLNSGVCTIFPVTTLNLSDLIIKGRVCCAKNQENFQLSTTSQR